MVSAISLHADILDTFHIRDRIFHPSGWSAPNDTDSGLSFGDGVEAGVGYMRMDVKDERFGRDYTLRGGYVEIGVGIGETLKSKALTTGPGAKIAEMAAKVTENDFVKSAGKYIKAINEKLRKPQSDLVFMPGGSITPFLMGPFMTRGSLELDDFRYATWVYLYVEADAGLGGNIGFMFMIHPLALLGVGAAGGISAETLTMPALFGLSKAWAPYWGLGVSLSLEVKVALRVIQDVQTGPLSKHWL
jgi:hypothetical protein